MNKTLDLIKQHSIIVADTANLDDIINYKTTEVTTNPTLLLQEFNKQLITLTDIAQQATKFNKTNNYGFSVYDVIYDIIALSIIKKIIPNITGRVSLEIDPNVAFSTNKTIKRANQIADLCNQISIDKNRILFKIAANYDGIRAAKSLQLENYHCNMTLIFSHTQAMACADAGATLISPFVGRIYDWYIKNQIEFELDPGVEFVKSVYATLKNKGYKTQVMGASFRNINQVISLIGCDLLTLSPSIMEKLQANEQPIKAFTKNLKATNDNFNITDRESFSLALIHNMMAYEKLGDGIKRFIDDYNKTIKLIKAKLN